MSILYAPHLATGILTRKPKISRRGPLQCQGHQNASHLKKGEQPEKLGSEVAEGLTEDSNQLVGALRSKEVFKKNYFFY